MAITNPFVLPAGVVFQAAGELSEQARRDIGAQDGDVVLSRPTSRARAQVVEAAAAELLAEFQEPSTIAFAVAAFSKRTGVDAERTLEDALPMLQSLINAGLLVLSNSEQAAQIQPSLAAEERVGSWTVLRCVQTMEDTEIYQAWDPFGKFGALKIGRSETAAGAIRTRGANARAARLDGNAKAVWAWDVGVATVLDNELAPRYRSSNGLRRVARRRNFRIP